MSIELREERRRREEEQAAVKREREQMVRDLRTLAGRPEGVRFMRWLLEQGGLFVEDYEPGPWGAYRAGRKATALRLWNLLDRHLDAAAFAEVTRNGSEDRRDQAQS